MELSNCDQSSKMLKVEMEVMNKCTYQYSFGNVHTMSFLQEKSILWKCGMKDSISLFKPGISEIISQLRLEQ